MKIVNRLYEIMSGNKTVSKIWDIKNYFEIGTQPISFITSKLPLLSSILLFWVYWDKIRANPIIIFYVFITFCVVYGIGVIWRKGGFYKGELESETKLNPIRSEIYRAAKRYNEQRDKHDKTIQD